MDIIKDFIHSPDFWYWHGFVLSVLWLFGSSAGILLKKKNVNLHLFAFVIVDYTSLFFMGAAIYLILPRLNKFLQWSLIEKVHVVGGLVFLLLMTYQHIIGAVSWHKVQPSRTHRKLGIRLAFVGRVLAGIGWLIQQHNRSYAVVVFVLALVVYGVVQKKSWSKIKVN